MSVPSVPVNRLSARHDNDIALAVALTGMLIAEGLIDYRLYNQDSMDLHPFDTAVHLIASYFKVIRLREIQPGEYINTIPFELISEQVEKPHSRVEPSRALEDILLADQ